MGCGASHEEKATLARNAEIQASSPLSLTLETTDGLPTSVDAFSAQTVAELLRQVTELFGVLPADSKHLQLEFAGVAVLERERTLHQIGMHPGAVFKVNGVEEVSLLAAASEGRVREVQFVCDYCPDRVNIPSDAYGWTPLHSTLHALFKEPGSKDKRRQLQVAQPLAQVVGLLVAAKADVNAKCKEGSTPLQLAKEMGSGKLPFTNIIPIDMARREAVTMLSQHGAR